MDSKPAQALLKSSIFSKKMWIYRPGFNSISLIDNAAFKFNGTAFGEMTLKVIAAHRLNLKCPMSRVFIAWFALNPSYNVLVKRPGVILFQL